MSATTAEFAEGDRVIYVPAHANGDAKHPDCERGIVSSTNDVNVFVRYFNKRGDLSHGGQATRPDDLVKAGSAA
jgi:hypothetical protein